MKKLYSLFAAVLIAAGINAQTKTITLTSADFAGLGINNYSSGAERVATVDNVSFGGKAITGNQSNTPAGAPAGSYIQAQATNGVIYNTTPLPGKIISITINQGGTVRSSTLFAGSTGRLVNDVAGNYTTTGTQVGSASNTGWTSADFGTNEYTYFAIKRGASAAYISSIVIEYDASALAANDIKKSKQSLVKNTSVENDLVFAAKSDVKVYNVNGQVVKSASVNENTSLNVSTWPKGIYIVSGNVDGEAVSQKIIKK